MAGRVRANLKTLPNHKVGDLELLDGHERVPKILGQKAKNTTKVTLNEPTTTDQNSSFACRSKLYNLKAYA